MSEAREPTYLSWGSASAKLLRTARLEAARAGHGDVMPVHLLLAVLDQPEMHQAMRALGRLPDIYAMRARVASSSLAPAEYSGETPLSDAAETALGAVRPHRPQEDFAMLYLFVFKELLDAHACRTLLRQGGVEPSGLEAVFARIG